MAVPTISVLMPVHNRPFTVVDAIRSIQQQTFEDWELIVLDDASMDRTWEACNALAAQDNRIRVVQNVRNLGAGNCRNRLLTFARGSYIAIHDSDDISLPHRFATQIEILKTRPDIGVVSGVTQWIDFDNGRTLCYYPEKLHAGEQYPQQKSKMIEQLFVGCHIANAACMFRKSITEKSIAPFGRYRVHEDWHFFIYAAHQALIWGIPEVLVLMRRGQGHSHLTANEVRLLQKIVPFVYSQYRLYKDNPESPVDRTLYRNSMLFYLYFLRSKLGFWRGCHQCIRLLCRDPFLPEAWKFLRGSFVRELRKPLRRIKDIAGRL